MLEPKKFKAPFIKIDDIRAKADAFRSKYWPSNIIPIDIFELIEFELEIEIRPINNLREAGDVDALLLGDLKTIVVDQKDFLNERAENRLRFSMAHEVGHFVLHPDIFSKIQYSSVEEWIDFFQEIPDDEYTWIEQHAYEFAGRLLVPREKLVERLDHSVSIAQTKGFDTWDSSGESTREYISPGIARYFGVSEQVIEKRLIKEALWPPRKK
ncbi:MAG: ImmA/IrrE family metallo-endopeptidase [Candidatus Schekmanbacteria bacterium]|nr:ImmA/IrrE family metallo-endopeptidase [Candidatus Schekmanbacteria bacterium]